MDLRTLILGWRQGLVGMIVLMFLAALVPTASAITVEPFPGPFPGMIGCMDPAADNFNPTATISDGSCVYPVVTCQDDGASNYNQEGDCIYNATLNITYPNIENSQLEGESTLTADFRDNDETIDEIEWVIYRGTCEANSGVAVAGNISGFSNGYEFTEGEISMSLDVRNLQNGDYCLVVDPVEQAEETNIKDSADLVVANGTRTVFGYKFEDINKNGLIDEGDTPVAGWTILALNSENQWLVSAVTDETGRYSFELQSGTWVISEDSRRGWEQVLADDHWEDEEIPSTEVVFTCTYAVYDFRSKSRFKEEYQCDFLNVQVEQGGSSSGTRVKRPTMPEPRVLGAATSTASSTSSTTNSAGFCTSMYLSGYMRLGDVASSTEVLKLQVFLNAVGIKVPLTGNFDLETDAGVRTFQLRYLSDVLSPWGISDATGYVYKTTRAKINNMLCPGSDPVREL